MKKTGKIWIVILFASVALFFVWIGFFKQDKMDGKQKGRNDGQKRVDAYVVSPTLLLDDINVSGTLLPFDEVELKNEVGGRVVSLNLPEGEFVKKGTLLVKIFDWRLAGTTKKTSITIGRSGADLQTSVRIGKNRWNYQK
ncbi:MAG: hypothetical protein QM751_13480 [Paludibacteraceae bacterium]